MEQKKEVKPMIIIFFGTVTKITLRIILNDICFNSNYWHNTVANEMFVIWNCLSFSKFLRKLSSYTYFDKTMK